MLYKMLEDMQALANSASLMVLSCSSRHVRSLQFCAVLISPCCAVFTVDAWQRHARIYTSSMY